jgi:flagellar hook protein FlgE
MLDILTKAKNAIEAYNSQLRINSSNIANMSVPGYKRMNISFQTIFENVLNGGTPAEDGVGGTNPIQFGSSVGIGNIGIDFSQGTMSEGQHLDVGVNGAGLFIVSPDDGSTKLYTRSGKFNIDNEGNLKTADGMQVYGFKGGGLVPIKGLTAYTNDDTLSWTNDGRLVVFNVGTDGSVDYSSVAIDTGYSIALTNFDNPSGLTQSYGNTFTESAASGPAQAFRNADQGFGSVSPRSFEQSNVFYTSEIIDSMEAQRAMSGNLTMVRMISDEITNFINRIS